MTYTQILGVLLIRKSMRLELAGNPNALRLGLARALVSYNEAMKLMTGELETVKEKISIRVLPNSMVVEVTLQRPQSAQWRIIPDE